MKRYNSNCTSNENVKGGHGLFYGDVEFTNKRAKTSGISLRIY